MRGKGVKPRDKRVAVGITPAYAGKSSTLTKCCREIRDHPRVCGEKHWRKVIFIFLWGSPPRMRGKAKRRHRSMPRTRITPAYAGKRIFERARAGSGRDHPRVCGEKPILLPISSSRLGSPPRMRGKDIKSSYLSFLPRITPAYAGKSPETCG